MIRDLDLAARLGYEQPRKIRDLIERLVEGGRITGLFQKSTVGLRSVDDFISKMRTVYQNRGLQLQIPGWVEEKKS